MKYENIDRAVKLRDELNRLDKLLSGMDTVQASGLTDVCLMGYHQTQVIIPVKLVEEWMGTNVLREVGKAIRQQRETVLKAIESL